MTTTHKRGWEKKTTATNSVSSVNALTQVNNFIDGLSAEDKAAHRAAFLHLMLSMTGTDVTVDLTKKSSITGIFHTSTFFADKKKQIVLKAIRSSNNGTVENGSTLFFDFTNDCVAMNGGSKIELVHKSVSSEFQTDSSIKKYGDMTHLKDRQLQGVDSSWLAADTRASLESGPMNNKSSNKHSDWDQFETNKRLFNVNSSFDENLYTKKLDLSMMTKEQIAKADRLAREIENTSSSNIHLQEERGQVMQTDVDEEDLYSGVIRTTATTTNVQKIEKTKENAWKRAPPSIKISPDAPSTNSAANAEPLTPPGIVISPKEVLNNTNAIAANKKNHKNTSPNKIHNSIGLESKGIVEPVENELKKINITTSTTIEPVISISTTTLSASSTVETKAEEEKPVASATTTTTTKSGLNANAKDWTPNVKAVEFVPKVFSAPPAVVANLPTMFPVGVTHTGLPPPYNHPMNMQMGPGGHIQPGVHLLPSAIPPGNIGINSAAVNGDQNPAGFQPIPFDGPGMQSIPPPQQFLVQQQQQPPMYATDYMYPGGGGHGGPMSGMLPMMDFSPGGANMMSMPMQMSPGGNIYGGGPHDPSFLNPAFMMQPGYGNQMMPHNMMNMYNGFPPQQMMQNPGMMNPAMQSNFNSPGGGYKYGGPGGQQMSGGGGGRGSKRGGNYAGNTGRGRGGGPHSNPGYNYPNPIPMMMSPMTPGGSGSSIPSNTYPDVAPGGGSSSSIPSNTYPDVEIPGDVLSEKETS